MVSSTNDPNGESIPVAIRYFAWGFVVASAVVFSIMLLLFPLFLDMESSRSPEPPSYDRVASPGGSYVAIVGSQLCEFDTLKAVWIARNGAGETEWYPILRWQEREAWVQWETADRLLVESRPAKPQKVTWEGITIEVRGWPDSRSE